MSKADDPRALARERFSELVLSKVESLVCHLHGYGTIDLTADEWECLRTFAAFLFQEVGDQRAAEASEAMREEMADLRGLIARGVEFVEDDLDAAKRFRAAQAAWESYGRTHKLSDWHDLQDAFGFASPEPECHCSACVQAVEARLAQGVK